MFAMPEKTAPLSRLPVGATGVVKGCSLTGAMRRRLRDIGLIEGTRVQCLQCAPSGDPAAYLIRGAVIALRLKDAGGVTVSMIDTGG